VPRCSVLCAGAVQSVCLVQQERHQYEGQADRADVLLSDRRDQVLYPRHAQREDWQVRRANRERLAYRTLSRPSQNDAGQCAGGTQAHHAQRDLPLYWRHVVSYNPTAVRQQRQPHEQAADLSGIRRVLRLASESRLRHRLLRTLHVRNDPIQHHHGDLQSCSDLHDACVRADTDTDDNAGRPDRRKARQGHHRGETSEHDSEIPRAHAEVRRTPQYPKWTLDSRF